MDLLRNIDREIHKSHYDIKSRLLSIIDDAHFVSELHQQVHVTNPRIEWFSNLRCGSWYLDPSLSSRHCYFKSTDGHYLNYVFSPNRHNLHVALSAGRNNSVFLVDSTRKGKRFPDSFSKTVPIWCAVLNSALKLVETVSEGLFLPVWVPEHERHHILQALPEFVSQFQSRFDFILEELVSTIRKPLRVIWISPDSSWDSSMLESSFMDSFNAIVCVSVSRDEIDVSQNHRRGWHYIQGAGDDEENWAESESLNINPELFWKHFQELETVLYSGAPNPSIRIESILRQNSGAVECKITHKDSIRTSDIDMEIFQISGAFEPSTLVDFVGIQNAILVEDPQKPLSKDENTKNILRIRMTDSKLDKFSVQNGLFKCIEFSKACAQCENQSLWILNAPNVSQYLNAIIATGILLAFESKKLNKEMIRKKFIRAAMYIEGDSVPRLLLKQLNRYFLV